MPQTSMYEKNSLMFSATTVSLSDILVVVGRGG